MEEVDMNTPILVVWHADNYPWTKLQPVYTLPVRSRQVFFERRLFLISALRNLGYHGDIKFVIVGRRNEVTPLYETAFWDLADCEFKTADSATERNGVSKLLEAELTAWSEGCEGPVFVVIVTSDKGCDGIMAKLRESASNRVFLVTKVGDSDHNDATRARLAHYVWSHQNLFKRWDLEPAMRNR